MEIVAGLAHQLGGIGTHCEGLNGCYVVTVNSLKVDHWNN